jgi:RNA polymerase sigma-70 factor (ECF subfamily)
MAVTLEGVSNDQTFEAMSLPLLDQLFNFAQWLTQDRTEAEDLVQETYAKALKSFSRFEPGTNFRAWMYKILRNSFLNTRTGMRAATEPIEDDEAMLPPVVETPETLMIRNVEQQILQASLAELPVSAREIVLLSDVEEMSYQEIASTLGIPIGTVMSRLSRARRALREIVRKKLEVKA